MERLLTPKELGEALGISPSTLYVWIHRGSDLPHVKFDGKHGSVRFREKSVQQWLESREKARRKRNFED